MIKNIAFLIILILLISGQAFGYVGEIIERPDGTKFEVMQEIINEKGGKTTYLKQIFPPDLTPEEIQKLRELIK